MKTFVLSYTERPAISKALHLVNKQAECEEAARHTGARRASLWH